MVVDYRLEGPYPEPQHPDGSKYAGLPEVKSPNIVPGGVHSGYPRPAADEYHDRRYPSPKPRIPGEKLE